MHDRLVGLGGRGISVRRLGGSRSGEIRLTRLLRNPAVTPGEMAGTAAARTASRSAGRHVLAIQDTTVLQSQGGGGLHLHATLAVDASDGTILGLVDGQFLHRNGGLRDSRRQRPIEEKESQRWLAAADRAAEICAAASCLTVIADREGDIYEAFARRPASAELLVRAAQDRSLEDGGRLFAALDALAPAARIRLDLPAGPGRRARSAELALRFMAARLRRPRNGAAIGTPSELEVQVVELREVAPPEGVAPVHWRLLTTHKVADAAAALAIAELYRRRWAIEQLFRTLKTQGFDVEALRIEQQRPRCNLVMAALVAAVSVQQLVHARDGKADAAGALRPVTDAFEAEDTALLEAYCSTLEGRTARQKNPHPQGSLAYAAWVCARLGGWTGYYGKPGPVVMLQGWLEIQAAKRAISAIANYQHV